jgi:hypothetical protein
MDMPWVHATTRNELMVVRNTRFDAGCVRAEVVAGMTLINT